MARQAASPASQSKLHNIKEDIRSLVSQDQLAVDLSVALQGLFQITRYERFRTYKGTYVGMYAKPTKTISGSLAIEREVFVLIANYQ